MGGWVHTTVVWNSENKFQEFCSPTECGHQRTDWTMPLSQSRALADLPKDQLSTPRSTTFCNSSSRVSSILFWPLRAPGTHIVYVHMQAKHTPSHFPTKTGRSLERVVMFA